MSATESVHIFVDPSIQVTSQFNSSFNQSFIKTSAADQSRVNKPRIQVRTDDKGSVVTGVAFRPGGTVYDDNEISEITLLFEYPRNQNIFFERTAELTDPGANSGEFHWDDTEGLLRIEGYWNVQAKYLLASGNQITNSDVDTFYVGRTLVPGSKGKLFKSFNTSFNQSFS